jgi:CheY-like chemotaxis protein/HPt (histidine-containing phosphotransfer) domain-containing protein
LTKEAADGETAVALAEAEKFDLILMDRELPGLDGTEAAARIRRGNGASAKAQIICVTAHQSPEVGLLLSDMEFDACAPKPLELSQLAAFVQSVNTRSIKTPHTNSLDCENLAQLKEILGEEGLTRTLTSFVDEIETARTELRDLIAHGDTLGAGRLVHKLAGLGDCLGAQSLSDKLRKFEDLTQNGAIEALDDALNSVEEIMGKTQVQAHHIIAETGRQCHTGPIKYQTSGHRHRHRLQQKV